ncbi:uncharacterized protein LOC124803418 [Schistocerca piceifrons]|uniref:uncharacterized protein LOC124803418 n=1 Tax=Schistocerca piceifrons TaxID=274613 RepID=UPI001F5F0747|nr:uncharacterized protein LOC124803418 [Schistocerca piceifrons]
MERLDNEIIIMEVQKHPWLYNTRDPEYKIRERKRESWRAVTAAVLGEKWDGMDNKQKSDLGIETQKRWKSMRDSYTKYMKSKGRSGDAATSSKPYVFYKQMTFLEGVLQQRTTAGNMNVIENEDKTESVLAPETRSAENISRPKPKKRKQDTFEDEIVKVLKGHLEQPTRHVPDADEMFLMSQLLVIRKLKTEDRLDFQMKFLQLLRSYTIQTSSPSPSSPSGSATNQSFVHHYESYSSQSTVESPQKKEKMIL